MPEALGAVAKVRNSFGRSLLTMIGFACLGTAGLSALNGLFLIIPQFH